MSVNPMQMEGRRILVTGASSGLGRDAAILLSQLDATVILTGRNAERLEETRQLLAGDGHVVEPFDLSDIEAIPGWMSGLAKRHGRLGGLVHSAGVHEFKPVRVASGASFTSMMTVNVGTALMLTRGFRQKAVRDEYGSIVMLSSVAGIAGQAGISVYSATKGALISLAKSLAIELAPENIRVNCVAPAVVQGGMGAWAQYTMGDEYYTRLVAAHPLGLGTPRDVSNAIAFLLSDASRWVTGTTLVLDGGFTVQ